MGKDVGKPELVIGLVGSLGTNLDALCSSLDKVLSGLGYKSTPPIRLSSFLREFPRWQDLPTARSCEYFDRHMDAGNTLRRDSDCSDALALLAVTNILNLRENSTGSREKPAQATAYILRSLKTPGEVEFLRDIYEDHFICIGAHEPRAMRVNRLAEDISHSEVGRRSEDCRADAERLISRDQNEESDQFGQNVRKASPMADIFVDASMAESQLQRALGLYFSDPFITPTDDEVGLYYAHASALRSASLGRQVGAAILDEKGAILSVGTNEMPRPGGGLYSAEVPKDKNHRQFRGGLDKSDELKKSVLVELISLMKELQWLKGNLASQSTAQLVKTISQGSSTALGGTGSFGAIRVNQLIEFVPEVHAEMAALIDAARRGVSIQNTTLYTTTFPCHDCAKHIVAAGIPRVVYLDPYPKSLVEDLYREQIDVDTKDLVPDRVAFQRFIGVAPRRYIDLFAVERRKTEDGKIINWIPAGAAFKLNQNPTSYIAREINAIKKIDSILEAAGGAK